MIVCPHCGQQSPDAPALAGHNVRCNACGNPFQIPFAVPFAQPQHPVRQPLGLAAWFGIALLAAIAGLLGVIVLAILAPDVLAGFLRGVLEQLADYVRLVTG